jgi:hypothetical protein
LNSAPLGVKRLSAGMDGHIGKPIDFEEVFEKLRDYWGVQ